jgi:hypothetical protein
MTADQESIFNMFRDTLKTGRDNQVFVNTIPQMKAGFDSLEDSINLLLGLASLQARVLTGISIDTNELKESMAHNAFNYGGPGRAWADANSDSATYNALNISEAKIKAAKSDLAGPIAMNIYNILNTNAAALVPYGLTAAQISELLGNINDYIAAVPLSSNAINLRQTYTSNIETAIRKGSDFLERQLDNIMRGQVNNNQDLVSTYFNSREIIDPPKQSTTFNILALDAATNLPLLNAKAEAIAQAKFAFTDVNGFCALKQFPKGIYSILVTLAGYNPLQIDNIPIGLGETKDLTFRLTKIP